MTPEEVLAFLETHGDWLSHATFWRNIGQMALFDILRGLYRVAVWAEGLIDQVLLARNFLENEAITSIFEGMLIFSVSLTALVMIIIAVRRMFNKRVNIKGALIRGCAVVALIGVFPSILISGINTSVEWFEGTRVLGHDENISIGLAIVRENVADMYHLERHGFDLLTETTSSKNTLTDESIRFVDFSEVITPSDITGGVFGSSRDELYPLRYVRVVDREGEVATSRITNGWITFFDDGYFRWTANWGNLFTSLPIISLFMAASAFMLLTTIFDLIFLKLLVPILAPTDIETGQKMKHIAMDAGAAFLSIILTGMSLSIFRILLGLIFALELNFLARLIYLSVACTVCMKGSTVAGKYLGVETGIGSGVKSMLGLGAAAVGVAKLGSASIRQAVNKDSFVRQSASNAVKVGKKASELTKKTAGGTVKGLSDQKAQLQALGAKDYMKKKGTDIAGGAVKGIGKIGDKTSSTVAKPFVSAKEKAGEGTNLGMRKAVDYAQNKDKLQGEIFANSVPGRQAMVDALSDRTRKDNREAFMANKVHTAERATQKDDKGVTAAQRLHNGSLNSLNKSGDLFKVSTVPKPQPSAPMNTSAERPGDVIWNNPKNPFNQIGGQTPQMGVSQKTEVPTLASRTASAVTSSKPASASQSSPQRTHFSKPTIKTPKPEPTVKTPEPTTQK